MDAETLLTTRCSNPKLTEPAPDPETLQLAFEAAVRAPDHGLVRPYRFLVIRDGAREALGELMAQHLAQNDPKASPEQLDKARQKPLRAPLIIAVVATLREHPKAPAVEQLLCAGAAAQNILLALHARGYAGIWRTGAPAYSATVKAGLGLAETDALVGFLYAGTAARPAPEMTRPKPTDHVQEWTG